MVTTTKQPTKAETYYDACLTAFQEYESDDNEQALILAGIALKKERNQDKHQEERILKELNRHLEQGRAPEKVAMSNLLVFICLLFAGVVAFIAWLCR